MSAASILDSMVSVTSLNHGGASKALSQVGDNHPVVVLKNNGLSLFGVGGSVRW